MQWTEPWWVPHLFLLLAACFTLMLNSLTLPLRIA
jgi:hypothetical protein